MRRYAGVIATCAGSVLLVREAGDDGILRWGLPSGKVEDGETFLEGAARELAEEGGLVVDPGDLGEALRVELRMSDGIASTSLTFTVEVAQQHTAVIDDPDGLVQEAAWFPIEEAIGLIDSHGYLSMIEPVVRFLTTRTPATWHYTDPRLPGVMV